MTKLKSLRAALTRLAALVFGQPRRPAPVLVVTPKRR